MRDQLDTPMDDTMPEATLNEVDQQMSYHASQLRHYRAEHNTLVPIARLHPELLTWIFREVIAELAVESDNAWMLGERTEFWSVDPEQAYHSAPMAIDLSHVCRQWRRLARADPLLWTEVWMTRRHWAWRMLERSRVSPLTVRMDVSSIRPARNVHVTVSRAIDLVTVALGHLERIQNLCLSFPRGEAFMELLSLLNRPAPMLQSLCIVNPARSRLSVSRALPSDVFRGELPPLKHLTIGGMEMSIALPLLRINTIEELCITVVPSWKNTSMRGFLDVLSQLHNLTSLVLRACIPVVDDVPESLRLPLRFRKLQWLELQDEFDSVLRIMDHIAVLPQLPHIRIHAHSIPAFNAQIPQEDAWHKINRVFRAIAPFTSNTRTVRLRGAKQLEGLLLNICMWSDVVAGADLLNDKTSRAMLSVDFEGQDLQMHDVVNAMANEFALDNLEVLSYCGFDETGYHLTDWPPVLARFSSLHTLWMTTQMLATILNVHVQNSDDVSHPFPPNTVRTLGFDSVVLTQALMNKLRVFLFARPFDRVQIMNSRIRKSYLDELEHLATVEHVKPGDNRGGGMMHILDHAVVGVPPAGLSAEDSVDAPAESQVPEPVATPFRQISSPFDDGDLDDI